jgi:hypothetical protein
MTNFVQASARRAVHRGVFVATFQMGGIEMWRTYYVDPADADRLALIAECAARAAERPTIRDMLGIAEHVQTPAGLARVARGIELELQRGRPS